MTNPVELLLCDENSLTLFACSDDEEEKANNDNISSLVMLSYNEAPQDSIFTVASGSEGVIALPPMLSDDCFEEMLVSENHHLPKDDYLERLRNGILPISARSEAIDWISMAASHFSFGTLCICLSVNYLDRFLSVYDLPSGKAWIVQLLAVACLSLAAKVEETNVPQSIDLQVGEPAFVFEAKTIQRMEFLVLSTLRWRMSSLTPCSFIDYFLNKINKDQPPSAQCTSRSLKLIVSTIKGIDFLSYKPSEIAAAVAICASGDAQVVNPDEPMSCFNHVGKERVLKCQNLIKDLSFVGGPAVGQANDAPSAPLFVPPSPIGVLDASPCLSYKSDEVLVGSSANSSHCNPDNKRRKTDRRQSQLD